MEELNTSELEDTNFIDGLNTRVLKRNIDRGIQTEEYG